MLHPWDNLDAPLPEPGLIEDLGHGVPGPAVPLPKDDRDQDIVPEINDDEDEEDD